MQAVQVSPFETYLKAVILHCKNRHISFETGYTLYDHKTNDSIRRELQTECILDKINEYRRNWLLHLQRMPLN